MNDEVDFYTKGIAQKQLALTLIRESIRSAVESGNVEKTQTLVNDYEYIAIAKHEMEQHLERILAKNQRSFWKKIFQK